MMVVCYIWESFNAKIALKIVKVRNFPLFVFERGEAFSTPL